MGTRRVSAVALLALLISAPAFAQRDSGDILGTVKDASGAVLPGATITLTNTGTGLTRTTVTDASGDYLSRACRLEPTA